jgi:transposase-like protein
MGQHFLLCAEARTLSLRRVLRLSEAEAQRIFCKIRWPGTGGAPVCPECGCQRCWNCPRANGAPRFRCCACRGDFSPTSGTLFAHHKLEIRDYLAAVVIFCNEVKGKSMLALSRDLGVQYKTAFVLAHKLREAMAARMKGVRIVGAGRQGEIDGAIFGGHVRPENRKADRKDRRLTEHRSGKRQCVVVIRERMDGDGSLGRTLAAAFKSEDAAQGFIERRLDTATDAVHADESSAWNGLHARFEMRRINHSAEYASAEACTNYAESFFSRMRRAELGHHHHFAGPYLGRYAKEMAWREDHRGYSNGAQSRAVLKLVAASRPSIDFCGYWQRARSTV